MMSAGMPPGRMDNNSVIIHQTIIDIGGKRKKIKKYFLFTTSKTSRLIV